MFLIMRAAHLLHNRATYRAGFEFASTHDQRESVAKIEYGQSELSVEIHDWTALINIQSYIERMHDITRCMEGRD